MKFIIIIFITCFLSINLNAQKIATFKFSLILENVDAYNNFTKELESFKKKIFVELKNEENRLISFRNEIEDSKVLFSENEYLKKISEYNFEKEKFENKVNKLNNYLQKNIEINENKILFHIIEILKKIAEDKGIDIVFSDDQYFLSSDSIDVSVQIYNSINNLILDLKLSEYDEN